MLARFKQGQGAGADDRDAAAVDDGLVRHVAPARAVRARGAGGVGQAARHADRRCARTSRPASRSRTRCAATPRSSTTSTSRWSRPVRRGGILETTLQRVADQLEKDDALRRQVKSAMMYPLLIGGFALTVLARARHVPRPGLREGLQGLRRRAARPSPRSRSTLSDFVTGQWYIGHGADRRPPSSPSSKWKRDGGGREQWDRFKLRMPWRIGDIVQKVALARFSRTFSALIAAGVPMLPGDRDRGQDRRQQGRREGDARRPRLGQKGGGTIATPMRAERRCSRRWSRR